jgi:CubicO group peptidase (beta-lactamase class C family)
MNAQPPIIHGEVAPGFEPVRREFERNFRERGEVGASCAIYLDGKPVVDIWGGLARPEDDAPWERDTLALVYSVTKGAAAILCHQLVREGLLDLDAPVASYWPEFGAAGKGEITVRTLLAHRAGLPLLETALPFETLLDEGAAAAALARQAPVWEPGTNHGYHTLTFGWLVGEIVHRVTGKTLGNAFRERIAEPLGIDFFIGLPESEEGRLAPLQEGPQPDVDAELAAIADPEIRAAVAEMLAEMEDPDSLSARAYTTNGELLVPDSDTWNRRDVHAAEIPAANGITNARSLGHLYAACVGPVDGLRVLEDPELREVTRLESAGLDLVYRLPYTYSSGFYLAMPLNPLLSDRSFGHSGSGGALGFADARFGIGFGYVQNMHGYAITSVEPRALALVGGLRESLGLEPLDP